MLLWPRMACRAASDPPAFRHSVAKVCRQRCERKRSTPESSRTLLTWVGGRAPPERKTPPVLQDLVGASQLEVLALERLQSSPFVRGQPRTLAGVTLGLPYPTTQRLRGAADLLDDRGDRRPLRIVLVLLLEDHPNCPVPNLGGEPARSCHDPILSRNGASGNPGAVQSKNTTRGSSQHDPERSWRWERHGEFQLQTRVVDPTRALDERGRGASGALIPPPGVSEVRRSSAVREAIGRANGTSGPVFLLLRAPFSTLQSPWADQVTARQSSEYAARQSLRAGGG